MPLPPTYVTSIPPDAEARTAERYSKANPKRIDYYVRGKLIGQRFFQKDGSLKMEMGYRNGVRHGMHYKWHNDGTLASAEPFENNLPHGTAYQFGRDGRVIGSYTLDQGTGIDLWRQEWSDGAVILTEVHYMKDGVAHGYEWWINADQSTVHKERHWREGKRHGIEREWNFQGGLDQDYPRYWVMDQCVDKSAYLREAEKDPTLPPFRPEDNDPRRTFPPEVAPHLGSPFNG